MSLSPYSITITEAERFRRWKRRRELMQEIELANLRRKNGALRTQIQRHGETNYFQATHDK